MSVNSVLINAATTHYVQTQLEDIVALATTVMKEMDSHVKVCEHDVLWNLHNSTSSGKRMSFISNTDIDECKRDTDFYDTNAECNDTIGSYECFCRTGYSGDGFNCTSMFMSCPLCRCLILE